MRVLVVSPFVTGGPWHALRYLIESLPGRLQLRFVVPEVRPIQGWLQQHGFSAVVEPQLKTLSRTMRPDRLANTMVRELGVARRIAAQARAHRATLIHQNSEALFAGGWAGLLARIPATLHVHSLALLTSELHANRWFPAASRSFRRIICVQSQLSQALADVGVAPTRLASVRNGVPSNLCTPNFVRSGAQIRVVTVAAPDPRKGLHHLVPIARCLMHAGVAIRFDVVGTSGSENAYARRLRRSIEDGRLGGCVFLHGYQPSVLSLLQRADVLLQPSESEALSVAQLEAMALHTVLLVSDRGGNRFTVKNNVNGWRLPLAKPHLWAQALSEIAHSPQQRIRMAENGQRYVRRAFCAEKSARALAEVWAQVQLR